MKYYTIPEWASSYVPTKQWYEFAPPHIAHTSPLSYAPPVPPLHPRARRCCNNCDCGCLLLLLFLGFLRSDPSRSTTTAAAKEKMEVYCLPFLILPWWCYWCVRRPIWDSNIVREIKPTLETIGWFSGWYGIMGEDRRAWSIKHQEGSVIIISFIIDRPWWMWMCSYLSILSSIDWMSIDSVVPGTGTGTVLWDNTRTLPYYNSDGQTIYK